MFTGIVQELAEVVRCERVEGLMRLTLGLSPARREGLLDGASVAVNGTCLTVARQPPEGIGFDIIQETLDHTSLGTLAVGDRVNVERSATFADEIGGHRVSGHVSGLARIIEVRRSPNNRVVRMAGDPAWMPYLFHKGFVALDGASLTISALDRAACAFEVSLIPETLERTTFGFRDVGDAINVEVDSETQAVVETVERVLADPEWQARLAR
ncbi:MAG TPA: riboflavin synthase subunit alpha [Pseudomonadales bacterium]|nr:riboflavin synthase subunit alpha [Pseudomonadales bacterium]